MKNREVRVFIASMMLVSLVAGSLAGAPVNASETGNVEVTAAEYRTAENKETAKTESKTKKSEEKSSKRADKEASSVKPKKEETVYAKIDGSGSVKSVTVSDQLKNVSDQSKLKDISDLQDIVNIKGDEAFSTMGSNVVWDTADADICYQGTTTKELPVGIKISYKLDGKDISAPDLKGKSGHVVIRYTYENKSGSKGKTSTPFMMATGLLLDEETFQNVKVENGKLISDGERNMVIGYGFPSMKNILGIEDKDVDIPDYFEVEADVTEYEPVEGLTIATNSIFNDLDTDDFDSLDELQDSMDELQDASSQLVSGSGELKNGIDTLLASSGTLTDGIDQLVAGGGDLQAGTSELADGSNQLLDGSNQLADGSKELADGSKELADGSKELADGSKELASGTSQLYDGSKQLKSGAGELDKGLEQAAGLTKGKLAAGATALSDGMNLFQEETGKTLSNLTPAIKSLDDVLNGEDGLTSGANILNEGLKGILMQLPQGASDTLGEVSQQLSELQSKADQIPAGGNTGTPNTQVLQAAENIAANANVLESQVNAMEYNDTPVVVTETTEVNPAAAADLDALIGVLSGISTDDEAVNNAVQSALGLAQSAQSNLYTVGGENVVQNDGGSQTAEYAEAAKATVRAIAADTNSIMQEAAAPSSVNDDTAAQIQELKNEIASLSETVNDMQIQAQTENAKTQALAQNLTKLQGVAEKLSGGLNTVGGQVHDLSGSMNGNINKMTESMNQLTAGSKALSDGISGTGGLVDGLDQLSAGAKALNAGSSELSEKMGEANTGAKTLASGASELSSGALELKNGAFDLSDGATDLASGAFDLADGASQLNDGALTLKDGLNTLQSGSGELIDGVQQLDDGAAELNDGMIQFDKDGIQKLVDAFGGDVEDLLDKMNEMLDASRAYKNFSGISDDMDGEVKFVFVTEE